MMLVTISTFKGKFNLCKAYTNAFAYNCQQHCGRVWLIWFLTSQSTIFQLRLGREFLGWTSTKLGLMSRSRAQHSDAGGAQTSRVKHSTTEPLRSLWAEGRRMTVEIVSWLISTKVWDHAGIELAIPGYAVRRTSIARHVIDSAARPGDNNVM